VGGDDGERERKVARAWTLHRQRWSSRAIGAELGVTHRTAQLWVEEARHAHEWAETTHRDGRRARMVGFLDELARRGIERLEGRPAGTHGEDDEGVEPGPYEAVVPVLMKVVQEINRVEGNYAPTRVSVEDDRRPPDARLLAAMEDEARRTERLDEAETRRELE